MASARYTWMLSEEDLKPPAPPPELTPEQKRRNFWEYHKKHFLYGGIALAFVIYMIVDVVTQVRPDYTIGLVTTMGYPEEIEVVLAEKLKPFFDDRNGDGEVNLSVVLYSLAGPDSIDSVDPNLQMANQTRLIADITAGDSILFLTNEPALIEAQYGMFPYNDGTLPPQSQPDYEKAAVAETYDGSTYLYDAAENERYGVRWGDCPLLAALDLGESPGSLNGPKYSYQLFLADFRLVPRVYEGTSLEEKEEKRSYYADSMAAYARMTAQS